VRGRWFSDLAAPSPILLPRRAANAGTQLSPDRLPPLVPKEDIPLVQYFLAVNKITQAIDRTGFCSSVYA
jgi:hypothetical protein